MIVWLSVVLTERIELHSNCITKLKETLTLDLTACPENTSSTNSSEDQLVEYFKVAIYKTLTAV